MMMPKPIMSISSVTSTNGMPAANFLCKGGSRGQNSRNHTVAGLTRLDRARWHDGGMEKALFWFRRDLRTEDNAGLSHALRAAQAVWCVFVFDRNILDPLPRTDRRVEFIRESLVVLDRELARTGGGLIVLQGDPVIEIPRLARELGVEAVYANRDDDPYALRRDAGVQSALAGSSIDFRTRKDHVVFERDELLSSGGTPFKVFTPYKNAWLGRLTPADLASHPVAAHASRLAPAPAERRGVPELQHLGFRPTNIGELLVPGIDGANRLLDDFLARIDRYAEARDFPAVKGPSYLSVHLRFGTVSIRKLAQTALTRIQAGSRGAKVWLSELVWRDFYHQILHHFPHVAEHAFRPAFDALQWEQGAEAGRLLDAWQAGRTGYPLVDAAMRQLAQTGYMHNRLRMLTASFLTKDLGVDYRSGERWFALQLNDFDLAANNGGWQWAASTGTDAQPWFRIFNPVTQSQKFDADGAFIRRYVPELAKLPASTIHAPWLVDSNTLSQAGVTLGQTYPGPIVDHAQARQRTLERYERVRTR
jgi:deoxyribodipyrimidine photo-lyase